MEDLYKFVDRIIEAKGVETFDDDQLDELKADLYARVEEKMHAVALEHLPPESVQGYEKLVDTGADSEEVEAYCTKQIKEYPSLRAAALFEFENEYLEEV